MNILILCTGNSCRSILAEALLNDLADGRVIARSAGSKPAGVVNPGAIEKLSREGHSIDGLSSRSWDEFSGPSAPNFDVVITVCDNAAGETCPVWSGTPITVHWGLPDPANASEKDRIAAFDLAYDQLRLRVETTLELPFESMTPLQLKDALQRIHDACGLKEG